MRNDDNQIPRGQVTGSHVAGVSVGNLPWGLMADFMRSGAQINENNLRALMTAMNPKLFEGTRGAHLIAIAKHYTPAGMLSQLPLVVQGMMANSGLTLQALQDLSEDDLTLLFMENAGRLWPEEGTLYGPQYNHQMLAENSAGQIAAMDPQKIVALFQKSPLNGYEKPGKYPRIIFTSSHASGESINDVTRITHGIEAMARDSWDGHKLNTAVCDKPITPVQTLILFSCDTERNYALNGAALTRRMKELKAREADGMPDSFEYASPGAKRLARLMLACMCENYYENGAPLFDIEDMRPLDEILGDHQRIRLSHDANKIAQHFQLMGYSKGGNVVSDAMRFLQRDLMAVDTQDRMLVRTSSQEEDRGYFRRELYGTRSLLQNINTMSMAARERPLTKEQKENGLRRVAFNNKHDKLTEGYTYAGSPNDEAYSIEGTQTEIGHDPEEAMGTRDGRSGYALNDEHVARRMKEFFAPHYGKAAIANLFLEDGTMKIETAPGTTESGLMRHAPSIKKAMEEAGLSNVELKDNHFHIGVVDILCDQDLTRDVGAIRKLGNAFAELREHEKGLVVAQKINDRDIPHLISKARASVGKHAAAAVNQNDSPGHGRVA